MYKVATKALLPYIHKWEQFIVFPDNLLQLYNIGMIQFSKGLQKKKCYFINDTNKHNIHTYECMYLCMYNMQYVTIQTATAHTLSSRNFVCSCQK